MDFKEVRNKISREGYLYVQGDVFKPVEEVLPKTRTSCFKCRENLLVVIAKAKKVTGRGMYYILYCPKCRTYSYKRVEDFNRKPAKPFHFDLSTERINRTMLALKGVDSEDIDEICDIYREDWKKEDEIKRKKQERERAERIANYQEEERKREQDSFKQRLDAGEIKFDKIARAFYEVSSGKIVRKL